MVGNSTSNPPFHQIASFCKNALPKWEEMTAPRNTIFIKCLLQRFPVISKWFQMISKYLKQGFTKNSQGSQNTPKPPNHSHHLSSTCIPQVLVFFHTRMALSANAFRTSFTRAVNTFLFLPNIFNQGFQFFENRLAIVLRIAHLEVFVLEILRARTQELLQCELAMRLQREQKWCMWWPRKIGAGLPTWPFVSAFFAAKMAYGLHDWFQNNFNMKSPKSRIQNPRGLMLFLMFCLLISVLWEEFHGISKSKHET